MINILTKRQSLDNPFEGKCNPLINYTAKCSNDERDVFGKLFISLSLRLSHSIRSNKVYETLSNIGSHLGSPVCCKMYGGQKTRVWHLEKNGYHYVVMYSARGLAIEIVEEATTPSVQEVIYFMRDLGNLFGFQISEEDTFQDLLSA